MSREYLALSVNRNNPGLFPPTGGTAPHNEVTAMHSDAQRNDNEATDPNYDGRPTSTDLPDGFRWDRQKDGKPIAVPTRDNTLDLHEIATEFFTERAMRDQEMPRDPKLVKAIDALYDCLAAANEFLGNGFLYSLNSSMAQELASSLSWVRIHAQKVAQHQQTGNEQALAESLINIESSRTQALKAAQVLDCLEKHNIKPDLLKGVKNALGLQGWRLANPKVSADRKAVQQTTRDYLFSTPPKQPDEVAEEMEDSLDAMNAA